MRCDSRFGLLFELIEDAVVDVELVDGVPVVREVNPAFVDIFGYDPETIVGESLNEFIVPETQVREATKFDKRTERGEVNRAVVSRRTAAGVRRFRYRGVPYTRDGGRHGLAIYTDITDQRRREQHHRVLHRVLRHNLRNRLTRIIGSAERLHKPDADVERHADDILQAALGLSELSDRAGNVEDILDSTRPERHELDLSDVLGGVVERAREQYPGATFEAELPDTRPVLADDRVAVAFTNLVENAVEHAGGSPVVTVTAEREGADVVVTVTDDGPGIPDHERAVIFDGQRVSQHTHSTGLGLWVTKWLVEGFGGRLDYGRADGRTHVSVRLPTAA
ncbi:sensor histidine kinase [Halorientalis litorea]|jgi:PAS domain S-box-containing protein|uniref:sensor histidine kinase n=1 Tax=Halorientalis litorea TaxID=2931977 RepID=UPI001FF1A934|nr:PAS domain-containing sensor histidine kinase [Halorientalis litorea]